MTITTDPAEFALQQLAEIRQMKDELNLSDDGLTDLLEDFDWDRCWRLTAGAIALGLELDPTRRGPIIAFSDELHCWVRFR